MNQACCGVSDGAARRISHALKLVNGLALAASPTFITMALLTIVQGDGAAGMLCAAVHPSPLNAMATMYLLMAAFHTTPWFNLIRGGSIAPSARRPVPR